MTLDKVRKYKEKQVASGLKRVAPWIPVEHSALLLAVGELLRSGSAETIEEIEKIVEKSIDGK